MVSFEHALNRLETRLQALVEGSLGRLYPGSAWLTQVAANLVAAMERELRATPGGGLTAPDTFTLFMPSAQAQILQTEPGLLESLAEHLQQAAAETGVTFLTRPRLRCLAAPDVQANQVQVVAQFGDGSGGRTDFLAVPSKPVNAGAAFLIVQGGELYPLTVGVTNIGRQPDNHLVLTDGRVSRRHAQLRWVRDRYMIFDLNSTGGTYVNGRKVTQSALHPGDVISLGGVTLVFGMEGEDHIVPTQEIQTNPDAG